MVTYFHLGEYSKAAEIFGRDSPMDENEKTALLKILREVRKMNDLQLENSTSIVQMKDKIDYYQELFESINGRLGVIDKNIIREIRVELLRLTILANPATQELFRSKQKLIPNHTDGLIREPEKRPPATSNPRPIIESSVKHLPESLFLTTTGAISLEPNESILVELLNPMESENTVRISNISGGGSGLLIIELLLNVNSLTSGKLMNVRNSNTALNEKGTTIAKVSTENINATVERELIYWKTAASNISVTEMSERLILAPGHSLMVRMTNQANQTNLAGLNISWWEVSLA